jgi:hypothetical protein
MSAMATTLPRFAGRIRAAVATVTVNLYNMWTETEYRWYLPGHSQYPPHSTSVISSYRNLIT